MTGYKTLYQTGASEITEKKSRFLGMCAPAKTEEEAAAFIAAAKSRHKTASHCVYAYILRENNLCRYSDAGEPQGTAGLPVLDILKRNGITDAVVAVVRYFGGTLLGTGGLVRAYARTAALAVNDAGVAVMELCAIYDITCAYAVYDPLQRVLEDVGAATETVSFSDSVTLRVSLNAQNAAKLAADVSELTRGQTVPRHVCDRFACGSVEQLVISL